ncbi:MULTISPECIES: twin-arginine translocase subunit TatC [Mycetocola]|uniref:Sec-independent protein translocase protein TatC n=1 Tax=Mycetocola lacteus TaxID=76637 RepID=A0A3L7ASU4_9MICO|nr:MULTISPECIES: twin-arginine translocase subunit TatC [Mycetocola]MCS4277066.1 sec-independent protein translocase protein TatC [Mycetocola sp. BIGb0189]RLP82528.1 twin-arginine translocase subunit TatC [Mycetocola lacteus]
MSLGAHLREFRKRLFISALGIVLAMIVGFIFSRQAIAAISQPIKQLSTTGTALLNFDTVTSPFDLQMKVALTIGVVLSSPVWLSQIWAFFMPALTRKEKLYAAGFVGAAIPLFLAGCVAGWLVFPHIVEVMAWFTPEGAANIYQAGYYYDFVLRLILAVGIAFVLPVLLVLLNFVGVLSAKGIIGGWRWAILIIALFCAAATPAADIASMFLLAIPMVVLYFGAWAVAWMHDRRVAKRDAAAALDPEGAK